ncbi:uncharacterized protein LOC144101988 isoform X2 [Amblyomma americanum]
MQQAPPDFLTVGGHRAMLEYRGMKRVCSRCRGEGHLGAACTSTRCSRCGAYGRETETLQAACKRCGGTARDLGLRAAPLICHRSRCRFQQGGTCSTYELQ